MTDILLGLHFFPFSFFLFCSGFGGLDFSGAPYCGQVLGESGRLLSSDSLRLVMYSLQETEKRSEDVEMNDPKHGCSTGSSTSGPSNRKTRKPLQRFPITFFFYSRLL